MGSWDHWLPFERLDVVCSRELEQLRPDEEAIY